MSLVPLFHFHSIKSELHKRFWVPQEYEKALRIIWVKGVKGPHVMPPFNTLPGLIFKELKESHRRARPVQNSDLSNQITRGIENEPALERFSTIKNPISNSEMESRVLWLWGLKKFCLLKLRAAYSCQMRNRWGWKMDDTVLEVSEFFLRAWVPRFWGKKEVLDESYSDWRILFTNTSNESSVYQKLSIEVKKFEQTRPMQPDCSGRKGMSDF